MLVIKALTKIFEDWGDDIDDFYITYHVDIGSKEINMYQQLSNHYPSYKKFFCDIDGKAALAFWEKYPAPYRALTVGVDELAEYVREASHNTCSTRKAEEILYLVKKDARQSETSKNTETFLSSIWSRICGEVENLSI